MPQVTFYINDKDYIKYMEKKEEYNQILQQFLREELKNEIKTK